MNAKETTLVLLNIFLFLTSIFCFRKHFSVIFTVTTTSVRLHVRTTPTISRTLFCLHYTIMLALTYSLLVNKLQVRRNRENFLKIYFSTETRTMSTTQHSTQGTRMSDPAISKRLSTVENEHIHHIYLTGKSTVYFTGKFTT